MVHDVDKVLARSRSAALWRLLDLLRSLHEHGAHWDG